MDGVLTYRYAKPLLATVGAFSFPDRVVGEWLIAPAFGWSKIDTLTAYLVHQRGAFAVRTGAIGHRVNKRAAIIKNVGFDRGDPIDLPPSVGQIVQKHRDIIIGIISRIATRPRAIEHDTFDPVAIQRIERGAEAGQNGIGRRRHNHVYIMKLNSGDTEMPYHDKPTDLVHVTENHRTRTSCTCSRCVLFWGMADTTQIEWTDSTWNPVTGCSKITAGCDFCYAERFSERFRGVADHPFEYGFDLTLRPNRLTQPLVWRQPRRIFVNSMSDLFHKDVPLDFIDAVFDTMEKADWHTYQVLTKRSSLLVRYLRKRYGEAYAPAHIWLGVSVEDRQNAVRLEHLKSARASVRFVSFEPLLGAIGLIDLKGIDWAIVGGESGPKSRAMQENWAIELRDQCRRDNVAFFFKQWGGTRPKSGGRLLKGREWNEYPNALKQLAQSAA